MTIYGQQSKKSSGGGSSAPVNTTYSALQTLYNAGTMVPGFYNITDRADIGIVIEAVTVNQLALNGTGLFLVPDFQSIGNYTGVEPFTGLAYTTTKGVWSVSKELITIHYNTLAGGTFSPGDTVQQPGTGASGEVVPDDGVGTLTCYRKSLALFSTGAINNDGAVTANATSVVNADSFYIGDIVFWNGLHYQLTGTDHTNGTNPSVNGDYQVLAKTIENVGYIVDSEYIEYNFIANNIVLYVDKRKNRVTASRASFQFGNDLVLGNTVTNGGSLSCINNTGAISFNTINNGAFICPDNAGIIQYNNIETGEIDANGNTGSIRVNSVSGGGGFNIDDNSGSITYNQSASGGTLQFPGNKGSLVGNTVINSAFVTITSTSTSPQFNNNTFSGGFNFVIDDTVTDGLHINDSSFDLYEDLTIPLQFNMDACRFERTFSNIPINVDMNTAFDTGVLDLQSWLKYAGVITLINNSAQIISTINNLSDRNVTFKVQSGNVQSFQNNPVLTATEGQLVSPNVATDLITGRDDGDDYIVYKRSGLLNEQTDIRKMA